MGEVGAHDPFQGQVRGVEVRALPVGAVQILAMQFRPAAPKVAQALRAARQ